MCRDPTSAHTQLGGHAFCSTHNLRDDARLIQHCGAQPGGKTANIGRYPPRSDQEWDRFEEAEQLHYVLLTVLKGDQAPITYRERVPSVQARFTITWPPMIKVRCLSQNDGASKTKLLEKFSNFQPSTAAAVFASDGFRGEGVLLFSTPDDHHYQGFARAESLKREHPEASFVEYREFDSWRQRNVGWAKDLIRKAGDVRLEKLHDAMQQQNERVAQLARERKESQRLSEQAEQKRREAESLTASTQAECEEQTVRRKQAETQLGEAMQVAQEWREKYAAAEQTTQQVQMEAMEQRRKQEQHHNRLVEEMTKEMIDTHLAEQIKISQQLREKQAKSQVVHELLQQKEDEAALLAAKLKDQEERLKRQEEMQNAAKQNITTVLQQNYEAEQRELKEEFQREKEQVELQLKAAMQDRDTAKEEYDSLNPIYNALVSRDQEAKALYTTMDKQIVALIGTESEPGPAYELFHVQLDQFCKPAKQQTGKYYIREFGQLQAYEVMELGINPEEDPAYTAWTSFDAGGEKGLDEYVIRDAEGDIIGFREEDEQVQQPPVTLPDGRTIRRPAIVQPAAPFVAHLKANYKGKKRYMAGPYKGKKWEWKEDIAERVTQALLVMHKLYLQYPGSGYSAPKYLWNRETDKPMTPAEKLQLLVDLTTRTHLRAEKAEARIAELESGQ